MKGLLALVLTAATAHAQGWEVRVPETLEVAAGDTATLEIAVAVDRGLVISKEGPVILDIAVAGGVTTRKPRLGRPDAVDPEADTPRFAVVLKASPTSESGGEHVVKIRLRMWLCGGRSCRPLDVRKQTKVVVTAQKPGTSGS